MLNRSDIYKGKDIPKKSGYSTSILVDKEGIMTNEQIYKYADKALKKQEARYNSIVVGTVCVLTIGMIIMIFPSELTNIGWARYIIAPIGFICYIVYFVALNRYTNHYNKMRRDFTYNLIRADERMKMYEWQTGLCKVHNVTACRIDCLECNKDLRKSLGIKD